MVDGISAENITDRSKFQENEGINKTDTQDVGKDRKKKNLVQKRSRRNSIMETNKEIYNKEMENRSEGGKILEDNPSNMSKNTEIDAKEIKSKPKEEKSEKNKKPGEKSRESGKIKSGESGAPTTTASNSHPFAYRRSVSINSILQKPAVPPLNRSNSTPSGPYKDLVDVELKSVIVTKNKELLEAIELYTQSEGFAKIRNNRNQFLKRFSEKIKVLRKEIICERFCIPLQNLDSNTSEEKLYEISRSGMGVDMREDEGRKMRATEKLKIDIFGKKRDNKEDYDLNEFYFRLRHRKSFEIKSVFDLSVFSLGTVDTVYDDTANFRRNISFVVKQVLMKKQLGFDALQKHFLPIMALVAAEDADKGFISLLNSIVVLLKQTDRDDYDAIYEYVLNHQLMFLEFGLSGKDKIKKSFAIKGTEEICFCLKPIDIRDRIYPIMDNYLRKDDEDANIVAIKLMNKLVFKIDKCLRMCFVKFMCNNYSKKTKRIKKILAKSLPSIACGVTPDIIEEWICPFFDILVKDGEWKVRLECLYNLPQILKLVPPSKQVSLLNSYFSLYEDSSKHVRETAMGKCSEVIATLDPSNITSRLIKKYIASSKMLDTNFLTSLCSNFYLVAENVGKERFHEIFPVYKQLSTCKMESVREIAASIFTDLVLLIGQTLSETYLLAILTSFLSDTQRVKLQATKFISVFLSTIGPETRDVFLTMLINLAEQDSSEWRYRLCIAHQIGKMVKLLGKDASKDILFCINLKLIEDPVYEVRYQAARNFVVFLKNFNEWKEDLFCMILIKNIKLYSKSLISNQRLLFLQICDYLVDELWLEKFRNEVIPEILGLADDKISNIRISLAIFIKRNYSVLEPGHKKDIDLVIEKLKNDDVPEVRCQFDACN